MVETNRIIIFYTEETKEDINALYGTVMDYLREADVTLSIIDVAQFPDRSEAYGIVVTPALVVERDGERFRYYGGVGRVKDIVDNPMNQSLAYRSGVKEGRTIADRLGLDMVEERETVEERLREKLVGVRVDALSVPAFDRPTREAAVRVDPRISSYEQERRQQHTSLRGLLSGIFTEIFGTGVGIEEDSCALQEADRCHFQIGAGADEVDA